MSPTLDEIVRDHGERLEELERGHLEVIAALGAPPDPSRGTPGTGMAGTLSQVAIDVREIRGATIATLDGPARSAGQHGVQFAGNRLFTFFQRLGTECIQILQFRCIPGDNNASTQMSG